MSRPIVDSSPVAKESADSRFKAKYDFPFEQLTVGKSFAVEFSEVASFAVLRVTADRHGKKLNKKFRCIKHEINYEVACVAEVEPEKAVAPVEPGSAWTPPKDVDPNLSVEDAAKLFMVQPGQTVSKMPVWGTASSTEDGTD